MKKNKDTAEISVSLAVAFISTLIAVSALAFSGCVGGSKPDYLNLFPQKTTGAKPKEKAPASDPEPMAIDQRSATNQVNLDTALKVNAELQAKVASDEIQTRVMATQIDSLANENNKLKIDNVDLRARLDFSVNASKTAGHNINDPVISWILGVGAIGTTPFCLFIYILFHRSKTFQRIKYGKTYKGS